MLRVHRRGWVIRRSAIGGHGRRLIRSGASEVAEKSVDVHLLGLVSRVHRGAEGGR